jgi:hypothetical protein
MSELKGELIVATFIIDCPSCKAKVAAEEGGERRYPISTTRADRKQEGYTLVNALDAELFSQESASTPTDVVIITGVPRHSDRAE